MHRFDSAQEREETVNGAACVNGGSEKSRANEKKWVFGRRVRLEAQLNLSQQALELQKTSNIGGKDF